MYKKWATFAEKWLRTRLLLLINYYENEKFLPKKVSSFVLGLFDLVTLTTHTQAERVSWQSNPFSRLVLTLPTHALSQKKINFGLGDGPSQVREWRSQTSLCKKFFARLARLLVENVRCQGLCCQGPQWSSYFQKEVANGSGPKPQSKVNQKRVFTGLLDNEMNGMVNQMTMECANGLELELINVLWFRGLPESSV